MPGPLKTLFGALQASTFLSGVSLVYGEEEINDASIALPMVAVVPIGGDFTDSSSWSRQLDPAIEMQWGLLEQVDLYLWACNTSPTAVPIDHVDAIESLRTLVLSALQDQRAQYTDVASVAYGLQYRVLRQRWQQMQNSYVRFGRALVLTVEMRIAIPMAVPQVATITSEQITFSVTSGPA